VAPFHPLRELRSTWTDLSLRTRLLLFAVALIALPSGIFTLVAFASVRSTIEREVAIQLHQTAEQGASALGAALERAVDDARSYAAQDLMRDLVVGDLDKRVSRLLRTIVEQKPAYVAVFCLDPSGRVVATSRGDLLGRADPARAAPLGEATESLVGPLDDPELGRTVLEIGVPIQSPDPPHARIGSLIVAYDWSAAQAALDGVRLKLANLGKRVTALLVDRDGKVIGIASPKGRSTRDAALSAERWEPAGRAADGMRPIRIAAGRQLDVLVGAAALPTPDRADRADVGWSVLFVEPASSALAPIGRLRRRWIAITLAVLAAALAAAALLARQVMRPLGEVTRATATLASHLDGDLPLLPVRSRNEVGQLAESFNKMTVELKRAQHEALVAAKLAFAGELAAMVAHEVRTPLSVMRSSAQMLADVGKAPGAASAADNRELVETIVDEVDRIERVVNGLLGIARPAEQCLEPTALRELLSRAADLVAAQAEKQGVEIRQDLADGAPRALCDAEQTYQVALNLLVNALQALPAGGHVWIRTLPERAGTVGFEVRDDGPGLPAEIRDRIFQPFVSGREGGVGLGLAIVERIVSAQRGSVSVESEPGRGTRFEVRLPAQVAA
jgi:two-component system, NtrC family, sensor histidine kinase HydH